MSLAHPTTGGRSKVPNSTLKGEGYSIIRILSGEGVRR